MTLQDLFNFMVKNNVLEAKCGEIELKLHPNALVPKMTKKEKEEWDKATEELNKEAEKFDKIDERFWSV